MERFTLILSLLLLSFLAIIQSCTATSSSAVLPASTVLPSCTFPRISVVPSSSDISNVLDSGDATGNACNPSLQGVSEGTHNNTFYIFGSGYYFDTLSTVGIGSPSGSACTNNFQSILNNCVLADTPFWGGWSVVNAVNYSISNSLYPANPLLQASSVPLPSGGTVLTSSTIISGSSTVITETFVPTTYSQYTTLQSTITTTSTNSQGSTFTIEIGPGGVAWTPFNEPTGQPELAPPIVPPSNFVQTTSTGSTGLVLNSVVTSSATASSTGASSPVLNSIITSSARASSTGSSSPVLSNFITSSATASSTGSNGAPLILVTTSYDPDVSVVSTMSPDPPSNTNVYTSDGSHPPGHYPFIRGGPGCLFCPPGIDNGGIIVFGMGSPGIYPPPTPPPFPGWPTITIGSNLVPTPSSTEQECSVSKVLTDCGVICATPAAATTTSCTTTCSATTTDCSGSGTTTTSFVSGFSSFASGGSSFVSGVSSFVSGGSSSVSGVSSFASGVCNAVAAFATVTTGSDPTYSDPSALPFIPLAASTTLSSSSTTVFSTSTTVSSKSTTVSSKITAISSTSTTISSASTTTLDLPTSTAPLDITSPVFDFNGASSSASDVFFCPLNDTLEQIFAPGGTPVSNGKADNDEAGWGTWQGGGCECSAGQFSCDSTARVPINAAYNFDLTVSEAINPVDYYSFLKGGLKGGACSCNAPASLVRRNERTHLDRRALNGKGQTVRDRRSKQATKVLIPRAHSPSWTQYAPSGLSYYQNWQAKTGPDRAPFCTFEDNYFLDTPQLVQPLKGLRPIFTDLGIGTAQNYYWETALWPKGDENLYNADFTNYFSPASGVIIAYANSRQNSETRPGCPDNWSEVVWRLWTRFCATVTPGTTDYSGLNYVFRAYIDNPATNAILEEALAGVPVGQIQSWTPDDTSLDNAFWPLLGSPNGNGIIYILTDHKVAVNGKGIKSISAVYDPSGGNGLVAYMWATLG